MDDDEFRFSRAVDLVLEQGAKIDQHSRWLDLGCHQGQFLRFLIARYGLRPTGADAWDIKLKGSSDATWDYIGGDFSTNFPDVGHELDFISAFEVIEHMIDTDLFLQRIRSALAPGGWLLLSTPNINSLRNRITVPFGAYPGGLEFRNVIHHVRLYNPRVLAAHLTESGFTNVKVRGVGFLPFSRGLGASPISAALANALPSLCNNFLAVARRPY